MDKLIAATAQGASTAKKPFDIIPFGEWRPDLPDMLNPGASNVSNVIPFGPTGYKPFKAFSASSTTPLSARCLGAASATGSDLLVRSFAGDSTNLYYLSGAAWISAASGFTLGVDERWKFIKAPNADKMLAGCQSETVQAIDMVDDTTFSAYFTSTLKPKPFDMAQVGSFLMLLNVDEGGTVYPDRVRWSSITDPADMDASATNQSDSEDLGGEYGQGQAIIGGETATIFLERAIFRASYVGSPAVFRFDAIETGRGLLASNAIARLGRLIFFLAPDGFFLFDGLESHPVGDRKVNQHFFDKASPTFYSAVSTAVDPEKQIFMMAYPSTDSSDGICDTIIMYHWPSGWWGEATISVEFLHTGLPEGLSIEGLADVSSSIDALPFSLDSKAWKGGSYRAIAFNTSHNSGTFTGNTLAATIDTGVREMRPGSRTFITGVNPMVDGGTLTAQVAGAARTNDSFTFGSAVAQTSEGVCPVRNKNRYHKFRLNVAAAGSWNHATGIRPVGSEAGNR